MKTLIIFLMLVFAWNTWSATVVQFSGGGAAAMSVQSSLAHKLERTAGLRLDGADVFCVSGGCASAVLIDRLGTDGAIKFMRDIRKKSDVLDRHWLISTFLFKRFDGIYSFEPLKKRMLKAIAGKPKRFKSLTVMTTDFDTMQTHYVETSNLSDEKLLDWVVGAKAIPMLVDTLDGRFVDSAIKSSFAKEPLFARPDIDSVNVWILNAHLHEMLERQDRDAAENGSRMLLHLVSQDNNRDIARIADQMFSVGNFDLHVYSMTKPISTFKYDRENIAAGLAHGAELTEIPHGMLNVEALESLEWTGAQ